jgi:hypothetical protein
MKHTHNELTIDKIIDELKKDNIKHRVADNGVLKVDFGIGSSFDWFNNRPAFTYTGHSAWIAYNMKDDFVILVRSISRTQYDILIHGVADADEVDEKMADWKTWPGETTLSDLQHAMKIYKENAEAVRQGLYNRFGAHGRSESFVANPQE